MELTTENTAIVLDSTSDFLDAAALYPNLRVVPLYVRFGDESLRDGIDITPESFYRRLAEAPELPTTSQPTPQDFVAVYEELAGYDRVWSIHLSAKLSGTVGSAALAAAELGGGVVRIVDSETFSRSARSGSEAKPRVRTNSSNWLRRSSTSTGRAPCGEWISVE